VEEKHRSRSRTSPTSSASSTPLPRRRTVFTATQVSSRRAEEEDEREPLDLDRTIAYRFGFVKWANTTTPPVSSGFISFPAAAKRYGPARSGFDWIGPREFWFGPFHFYLFSRPFSINLNMFQIWFSNLNSKSFTNPFVANKYALESL
jgi:hypothetical protein